MKNITQILISLALLCLEIMKKNTFIKLLLIKGFPILYQENFKKLPLKNSFDAMDF